MGNTTPGIATTAVFACCVMFVLSCGSNSSDVGATSDARTVAVRTIGVTLLTKEHEFYRQLESGMQAAAAKHGYRLLVTSGDFDLAKQQSEIDNFLVQHVDAIVVCPVDSRGIGPAIERATAAHIPVFTADVRADGVPVVARVASDNIEGGRLAAQYMAHALGDSGAVAVIGQQETQTGLDRQTGFVDEMSHHPNIKVVAIANGGGVRDRALKAADDVMQGHPELRGIFGINDDTALGALTAAKGRGKSAPNFTIVGYDATPEAVAAIKGNTPLKADVAQSPQDIGAKTIDAIGAYFDKQPVDSVITVPVRIVDSNG
jgi:ribose transport system substrate-binding protein